MNEDRLDTDWVSDVRWDKVAIGFVIVLIAMSCVYGMVNDLFGWSPW